jgi:hypothetical protein
MNVQWKDCEPQMQQLLDEYEEFVGEVRDTFIGGCIWAAMGAIVLSLLL